MHRHSSALSSNALYNQLLASCASDSSHLKAMLLIAFPHAKSDSHILTGSQDFKEYILQTEHISRLAVLLCGIQIRD